MAANRKHIIQKKADLQRKEQELNGLGFLFSKWTGLKFVEFLKEKIEKLPFGLREKKKGKTVKRLVNLEENNE